jgi:hyperosmotically inducible periplasmic protein
MKTQKGFLIAVVALPLLALAQPAFTAEGDPTPGVNPNSPPNARGISAQKERLGTISKGSEVIGMEIQDAQNRKLGKVEELAVDLQPGRIVYVIVKADGKTTAVPPRAFTASSAKTLRLDATKEKLQAAPEFEAALYGDVKRAGEIYRHFGQQPYSEQAGSRATSTAGFEKASKVIGMSVKNRQDQKLGTVDNLAIDLPTGRIVQVIVSSGGFLGMRDELSAVPPAAFHYDRAQEVLHLDTTKEALTQAPHFKKNQWPDLGDPAYAASVYRAHGQEPYFSQETRDRSAREQAEADKDADNTGRNVRDRESDRLTPIQQGSSEADVEMTRNIRREIVNQKNFSVNAKNVKVITANGRVTLRGPVNTEDEKRLIAEIAARMAQPANVDNQLEVKTQVRD